MSVKLMAGVVISLLALAAVIGSGAWLAGRHYQPTIDKLNKALTQCSDARKQQDTVIDVQNAGIAALQRADDERQAKAKQEQAKARKAAQSDYSKANAVLAERSIGEVCAAASAAFDAELRQERAQ